MNCMHVRTAGQASSGPSVAINPGSSHPLDESPPRVRGEDGLFGRHASAG